MTYGWTTVTERAGTGAVYEAQHPQGVYRPEHDDTVVAYRGEDADPFVTRFDHQTGRFDEPLRIGDNRLPETDNHGPPSVCVDEAGRPYVFYGAHNSPTRVARAAAPDDLTEWEHRAPLDDPPGSYPCPDVIDGDIYVVYRTGDGGHGPPYTYPQHEHATVARSDDGAASWTTAGPVIDTSGHPDEAIDAYVMDGDAHDGRFRITWGIAHGEHHDYVRSHAFHAAYDPDDGHCYGLDGTDFGETVTWDDMKDSALQAFEGIHANQPKHAMAGDTTVIVTAKLRDGALDEEIDPLTIRTGDTSDQTTGCPVMRHLSVWDPDSEVWTTEPIPQSETNNLWNGFHPRFDDSGRLEVHAVTGGDEARPDARGGDLSVLHREANGWNRTTVVPAGAFDGDPIGRLSTVRHGTDALPALAVQAGDHSDVYDRSLLAYGTAWPS